jgi:hypothetical protein
MDETQMDQKSSSPESPSDDKGDIKIKFPWKDFFTTSTAVIAVLFSGFTFYLVNIHVKDDLEARIIGRTLKGYDGKKNDGLFEVAFFNNGNRPEIIIGIKSLIAKDSSSRIFSICDATDTIFPILLQPHDIRLIKYIVTSNCLLPLFDNGFVEIKHLGENNNDTTSTFYLRMEFNSVDSKGKPHKISGPMNSKLSITLRQGVNHIWNPVDWHREQFPSIDLFEETDSDL